MSTVGRWVPSVLTLVWLSTAGFAGHDLGKKPPPYAFALPPLEIVDRLAKLDLGAPKLTADERALLASIWQARQKKAAGAINEADLLDAMMFSSGVTDGAARKKYKDRYIELAARAKAELTNTKTSYARGEAVMTFLHKGVMAKGYSLEQTRWTDVFDSGRYNCVSATAMVYLVGTHVGLELIPISIPSGGWLPGHATLDMIDGKSRFQVEATNPDGFDWKMKMSRPGVISLGFVPDRKNGHEVDGLGVAAMIYSNRGVALGKAKSQERVEQASLYLSALALNPSDPTSNNNLMSLFVNWGPELAKNKKFEEALRVGAFGLSLAPKNADLRNNLRFVWSSYLSELVQTGKDDEVVRVVARVRKSLPDDADLRSIGRPFRTQSQKFLEKKDADQSLKTLVRAYALDAQDRETLAGIAYHTHETLTRLFKEQGLKPAIEHYQEVVRLFPKHKDVETVGWQFSVRCFGALADKRQFAESLALVEAMEPIIGKRRVPELGGIAYDRWGRHLSAEKQWQPAIAKYQEGIKKYPEEKRLVDWASSVVDRWADTAIQAKNWEQACRIYETGLQAFPEHRRLTQNLAYCQSKLPKK